MGKLKYTNRKNQNISFNSFLCKDGLILYKIVRKDEAHLFLEYLEEENYYIVTCNKSISELEVKQYVMQNYEWVMNWYKNVDNPAPWFIFGKEIPVNVIMGNEYKTEYLGDKINIYLRHKRDFKDAVKHFYKELGSNYLVSRTMELLTKLGLKGSFGRISWATYYYGKCHGGRKIDLNAKLMQYSKEFIDSVIYHELAHISHMNHKREFWNLLTRYCPNHKALDHEAFNFKLNNKVW